MGKHLVLIGGGHAHMVTLAKLHTFIDAGHQVTVIGPSDHHYYSGMGPGMLGKTYAPDDIRFRTRHVVEKQGGTFVRDVAVGVDPKAQKVFLQSGDPVEYDVASFNAGSQVSKAMVDTDTGPVFSVKPIERLQEAQTHIQALMASRNARIAIVGGGPSSVEISGNIWQLGQILGGYKPQIHIYTGRGLMEGFPNRVRQKCRQILTHRGIHLHESCRVEKIDSSGIHLPTGTTDPADLIFMAIGVKPSPIFAESNMAVGPDGGLAVNQYLQSTEWENIFGGGDCIYFTPQPLDKVGVYAVRENPILFANLTAALNGDELTPFDPGGSYLLIFNLGGGQGVLHKSGITFSGKIAFRVKDYIDCKFIKEFQAIE